MKIGDLKIEPWDLASENVTPYGLISRNKWWENMMDFKWILRTHVGGCFKALESLEFPLNLEALNSFGWQIGVNLVGKAYIKENGEMNHFYIIW